MCFQFHRDGLFIELTTISEFFTEIKCICTLDLARNYETVKRRSSELYFCRVFFFKLHVLDTHKCLTLSLNSCILKELFTLEIQLHSEKCTGRFIIF